MKFLITAIMGLLLLCGTFVGYEYLIYQIGKEKVIYEPVIPFISNEEYKKVLDFHGIKGMGWSHKYKDFIFKRDGEWCKSRTFELLRGDK